MDYAFRVAALAAWSGVMLYFTWHGELRIFLAPIFQVIAAVGAHVLALFTIAYAIVARPRNRDAEFEAEHHHHHEQSISWLAAAVLIFPVSLAAMTTPSDYTEQVLRNRGVGNNNAALLARSRGKNSPQQSTLNIDSPYIEEGSEDQPATDNSLPGPNPWDPQAAAAEYINSLPSRDGHLELNTLDLLYGIDNPALRSQLAGRDVRLIGQYYQDPGSDPQQAQATDYLVRMVMVCCAADAQPASVQLVQPQMPGNVKSAGWIEVEGRVEYPPDAQDNGVVLLHPQSIESIKMPNQPFLY
jgi:uncharacterized repeat protein (TIGR03943 family)